MGQLLMHWYGGSCFSFQYHGWSYVIDPHTAAGEGSGRRLSLRAHEALHSQSPAQSGGGTSGASILPLDRPAGDRQIQIQRVLTYGDDAGGALRGSNTVHIGRSEGLEDAGVTLVHLGRLGHVPREQAASLMNPTILLIPVGGGDVLTPEQAWETIRLLKPAVCVPMCFMTPGDAAHGPVGEFLIQSPEEWTIRHLHSPELQFSAAQDYQRRLILVPSLDKTI